MVRKPTTRRHTRPPGDAYEDAIRFLGPRARSVAEIRRQLRGKQHDEVAIDGAIERLRANGHLDDVAFARYWLEQRERFRPKGDRALVSELLQKGVAREAIDAVLGERAPNAQLVLARAAIRKPLAALRARVIRPPDPVRKATCAPDDRLPRSPATWTPWRGPRRAPPCAA